jgi:hypothetical protein
MADRNLLDCQYCLEPVLQLNDGYNDRRQSAKGTMNAYIISP